MLGIPQIELEHSLIPVSFSKIYILHSIQVLLKSNYQSFAMILNFDSFRDFFQNILPLTVEKLSNGLLLNAHWGVFF